MKALSLLMLAFVAGAASAEITIFDVRRTLRMSDNEPVFHDYYVNGGIESGLAVGQVITVTRKLPLYDNYQNRSAGDLHLKVARLKIIHVQKGLAVGRLQSEFTRDNAPLLEDPFIMVGDDLDMATATTGKETASADSSSAPAPAAAPEPKPAAKAVAQISVNSVDLSSVAPASKSEGPAPASVDAPILQ